MQVTKRSGEEIEKFGGNWGRFVEDIWRSGKKPGKFMRFGGDVGRYWRNTRRSGSRYIYITKKYLEDTERFEGCRRGSGGDRSKGNAKRSVGQEVQGTKRS
jgi:hypothetical protein